MSEENKSKITRGEFVIRVLKWNVALVALILALSFLLGFDFGFCYCSSAIILTTIGAYLGSPTERSFPPDDMHQPVQSYNKNLLKMLEQKIPAYGVESVIFYSGLVALIFSMPYICRLMYF